MRDAEALGMGHGGGQEEPLVDHEQIQASVQTQGRVYMGKVPLGTGRVWILEKSCAHQV